MSNSLHRAFLPLTVIVLLRNSDQSTERHYFDHKQASQVPHKPFTEAILLSSGLHSVKRGDSTHRSYNSVAQARTVTRHFLASKRA